MTRAHTHKNSNKSCKPNYHPSVLHSPVEYCRSLQLERCQQQQTNKVIRSTFIVLLNTNAIEIVAMNSVFYYNLVVFFVWH